MDLPPDWAEQIARYRLVREKLTQAQSSRKNTSQGIENEIAAEDTYRRKTRLWIVDRILEPQTIVHFLEFTVHGHLPGGGKSKLQLVDPAAEEINLFTQPYSEWAPEPFRSTHGERSLNHYVMTRIGSDEDPDRILVISKALQASKSRAWEGLVPLSERRWREKKLDEPENFHDACLYLVQAVDVFDYLDVTNAPVFLRETYRLIYEHLVEFSDAVNAMRQVAEKPSTKIDFAALWAEYMSARLNFIAARQHAWVMEKIARLREPIFQELEKTRAEDAAAAWSVTNINASYSPLQWDLTNKLHDLLTNAVRADIQIMIPLAGYVGLPDLPADPEQPRPHDQPLTGASPKSSRRCEEYQGRRRHLTFSTAFTDAVEKRGSVENDGPELVRNTRAQVDAQETVQREMRGEPPIIEMEEWVARVHRNIEFGANDFGFVAYRTCHDIPDEAWLTFVERFHADIADWGDGVLGAEKIRDKMSIQWLGARELGIEDTDMAGIKSHFLELIQSNEQSAGRIGTAFLVADRESIDSYLNPGPDSVPSGDGGGFITAIDPNFDAHDRYRPDESPGYKGSLRVLGSLLWDDFYPLLLTQSHELHDLWPLAMHHPRQVYVGPVIASQRQAWAMLKGEKYAMDDERRTSKRWTGNLLLAILLTGLWWKGRSFKKLMAMLVVFYGLGAVFKPGIPWLVILLLAWAW